MVVDQVNGINQIHFVVSHSIILSVLYYIVLCCYVCVIFAAPSPFSRVWS